MEKIWKNEDAFYTTMLLLLCLQWQKESISNFF